MRIRKKKHTNVRLAAHSDLIIGMPSDYKNHWREKLSFPKHSPLRLEIGCGKGDFACQSSKIYSDGLFIAMELMADVIVRAVEKAALESHNNLKFIIGDAKNLLEYFGDGEVTEIFLNFSDPWKKRYQHPKRLTHSNFLEIYRKLLHPNGIITFKTDNTDLFNFSVKSFSNYGFKTVFCTENLHLNGNPNDNIMTEYENTFVSQGVEIKKIIVQKTP